MINITKAQVDPQPLEKFKNDTQLLGVDSHCNYDLFLNPEKNNYKKALLEEQHYLCAYCNINLDEFSSDDKLHLLKIEHWYPQSLCKLEVGIYDTLNGKDVAHQNMIIVCPGENVNPNYKHCDGSRSPTKRLTIKPQDPNYLFNNIFTYEAGKLKTDNPDIFNDIKVELNLNEDNLVRKRNIALDQVRKQIPAKNLINKATLIQKYSTPNKENRKRQYCTLIINYIENL
jgi:hypothetical protein